MLLVRIRTILGLLCLGMFMVSCILDGSESASLQVPTITTGRLDALLTGRIPGAPADTDRTIDSIRIDFVEDSGTTLVLEWLVSESPVSVDLVSDSGPMPYSSRYQSSRSEIIDYNQFGGPIWYTVYGDTVTLTVPVFRSGHHMLRISGGHGVPFRVHVARKAGIDAWLKAPDGWEDDNLPSRATLLQEGVSQTHTMTASLTTDVDWFRFPVTAGWNYWVERVDSVGGRTLLGDLHTGAQKRLGGDVYHADQSGEMYYRVSSSSGAGDIYRIVLHASLQEFAGLVVPDSFETDDSSHPVVLSAGQRLVRGTLHSYSDSDWFRIAVDSGKTYSFTLKDTAQSAGIGLWDSQGDLNPASIQQGNDSSFRVTYPAGRSGDWIIQVVGPKVTAYSLTIGDSAGIRADAVQDRYEPDGIPALASLLPADSSVQNRSFHWNGNKADTDCIAFLADSGKTYTLRFQSKQMAAPEVEILSPSYKPEPSVARSSIYRKTVTFACLRTGRYLARARGSVDQYTVLMTAADTLPAWALPEVGEPDDGPATAQVLRGGESTVRRLDLADEDWIQVPVEKNRRYTLSLENAALLEKARIFLSPVAELAGAPSFSIEAMGGKSGKHRFDAYEDGIACFKLKATGVDSGTVIPYTLKVESEPMQTDALEPDSGISTAAGLVRGAAYAKRWVRIGDEDWMSYEVEAGRPVSFFVRNDGVDSAVGLYGAAIAIDLYGADSARIDSRQSGITAEVLQLDLLPARSEKVFLKVSTGSGGTQHYGVRAETRPAGVLLKGLSMTDPLDAKVDSTPMLALVTGEIWYRIPVLAGRTYSLRVEGDVPFEVERYDASGASLENYSGSLILNSTRVTFVAQAEGYEYIKATLPQPWAGTEKLLRVWVAVLP